MNCTICNKPIQLNPSAAERAAADITGKTAAYFDRLFTTHTECVLAKRHTPPKQQKSKPTVETKVAKKKPLKSKPLTLADRRKEAFK